MLNPPNLDLQPKQIWETKVTPTAPPPPPSKSILPSNSGSQRHKQPAASNLREPSSTSSAVHLFRHPPYLIPRISSGTTIGLPAPEAVTTYHSIPTATHALGLFSWILLALVPTFDLPASRLNSLHSILPGTTPGLKWTIQNDLQKSGLDCLSFLYSPTPHSPKPLSTPSSLSGLDTLFHQTLILPPSLCLPYIFLLVFQGSAQKLPLQGLLSGHMALGGPFTFLSASVGYVPLIFL